VNSKIRALLEYWGFPWLMSIRHDIYLSGLLGIHLSLRMLVVFLDIHFLILECSMLDLIMTFFGVTCKIILIMLLIGVLIMHTMLNLKLHYPWTILTML